MNEKNSLVVSGATKYIQHVIAITLTGLLASSSVHAADDTPTFSISAIPDMVWVLAFFILVFCFIQYKNSRFNRPKNDRVNNEFSALTEPEKTSDGAEAEVLEIDLPPQNQVTDELAEAIANPEPETKTETETTIQAQEELKPDEIIKPDVLEEAKKLVAQERLPQAVGALNKGLQKEPARSDLMLQLLEIYIKQNDIEAFDAQFEQLKQLDDPFTLIQAEELHSQITRSAPVASKLEQSDAIDFDFDYDFNNTNTPESASTAPTSSAITAEALNFTLEKNQTDEIVAEAEFETKPKVELEKLEILNKADDLTTEVPSIALNKPVIAALESDFSLDDIDLKPTNSIETEVNSESADKLSLNDFKFSEMELNIPETGKSETIEPTQPNVTLDTEAENKSLNQLSTKTPLIDLDFDFDESFAIDEDPQISTKSEKNNWTTDLADENFASTETAPVTLEKLGEPIKGDRLSALEEEFPFLQSVDIYQTRLDLARSYIILGEIDSARELLHEVAEEGASAQQSDALKLIAQLAS